MRIIKSGRKTAVPQKKYVRKDNTDETPTAIELPAEPDVVPLRQRTPRRTGNCTPSRGQFV